MKRNRIIIAALACVLALSRVFAMDASDSSYFSEMNSAFSAQAYPLAVEYADKILAEFPQSTLVPKVHLSKGQSLYFLDRYSEAEDELKVAAGYPDVQIRIQSNFYLGMISRILSRNSDALSYFYRCCELAGKKGGKSRNWYSKALFYAGQIYHDDGDYKNGCTVFESVVSNGTDYDSEDYAEAFRLLFDCYLKLNRYRELAGVYQQFPKDSMDSYRNLYEDLTMDAVVAYEETGKGREAFECCKILLESEDQSRQVFAVEKMYSLYGKFPAQIKESPIDLVGEKEKILESNPALLAEIWIRTGTDRFEHNDYTGADSAFVKAEGFDTEKKYAALIGLYRAKMSGNNSIELLNSYSEENSVQADSTYYADYEASFAEQYAKIGDWENSLAHAQNAIDAMHAKLLTGGLLQKAFYYKALAVYSSRGKKEALDLILNSDIKFVSGVPYYKPGMCLYARCLAENGREKDSLKEYEKLYKAGLLDAEEKNNYAKVLFSAGYASAARKLAQESGTRESLYVAAISAFNLKNWDVCIEELSRYMKSSPEKKNLPYCVFYSGYAYYRLGNNSVCESMLRTFAQDYPNHPLCFNAAVTCANAYVLDGNHDLAQVQAANAVKFASSRAEKERAVILSSTIYEDSGMHEKALAVLAPYASENSDFGVRARFQSALILAKMDRIADSDKAFGEICTKFPDSAFADESCYRRGEIYYAKGNFTQAAVRYKEYVRRFPRGKFIDSAYYYLGDSYRIADKPQAALLQFMTLADSFPESGFAFNARRYSADILKGQKKYREARDQIEILEGMAETAYQKNELQKEKALLEKLAKGGDSRIVILRDRYESEGRETTAAGRQAGTELAELLWTDESSKMEAAGLAEKLYEIQVLKENIEAECANAARCLLICAELDRSQNRSSEAAAKFLETAKLARQAGNGSLAERSLYGAAESFDAASMYGDARVTAENLLELYPRSSYAAGARKFIER